ncbi:MAG: SAM-dependent methyltransferase [Sulfurimonas sp. RIFOXYD12_FULL_33_39]|uniref:5-histidylcysteine sulfoxide synthase n=1 Tax=unclassified Sulfurimonas TaxID=2623549 RepID=UPI0008D38833|nr:MULTISPECIES: 5-histidylcysteine sulfoxide synthase [unclassified Sulfurimonas]OHE08812.1 MAG: SAM-dependent methyltransferase [Sulfurimonas sp. RIFOXYD12_FULL_33_39]OHE14097.1 MAG: SAM-dependent methyltransferase [Sulfurimonas sp. RIFOXYD2_FULL_34_21]DAB27544.1 MAG TPA: SAM-dependent methyltransferase [Sulfurimonas sp. UBA10385]
MSRFSLYPVTLDGDDTDKKRQEIKEYFHNTYSLFEKIFDVLKDDKVFYKKSEITRHPMIFYFGHTATFFINKLINMKIIKERINPEFESIFAIGVDEMAWDDVNSSNYKWPKVDEVREYRAKVREIVDELITTLPMPLPITDESPMWIILMGIEHERIHVETSLVLHRQMPIEFVKEVKEFNICTHSSKAPKNEMLEIKGGDVVLGKEKSHNLYGWDNEYGKYEESVEDFKTSKFLVSNGEYMSFVEDGGYENEEFWDKEGRAFLKISGAKHPTFWVEEDDVYMYRTLGKIIDMPLDWPVDVNALEAEAFCRYKSKKEGVKYSLPSEAEYRLIYEHAKLEDIPDFHESRANLNFYHYFSSCPVNEFAFNGIYDVVGNVWQWSRTPIFGFNGFEVHPAYDDFSTPTFDNKHALILGSSWASSGNLIMKHSRYAFRKHFYQNAGFRYVITSADTDKKSDIYESDELVSQYCEFQYGDSFFGVENFALTCTNLALRFAKNQTKALDLGCATGRATFELARSFDEVEGIDFSARFIGVGVKLKNEGYIAYRAKTEGDLSEEKKVTIKELGYENIKDRVSFWQGDACNLKPNFSSYDLILAKNLIDRLYNPKLFLDSVHERLESDGILVLTSPYTWQESSTKKEFWLGGYKDENGKEVQTMESLKEILGKEFELLHVEDAEFVIKETARKFQHSVAEVSVWRKR